MLNYLSRYVFRTAISNARILDMDQSHVTFRWKDRSIKRRVRADAGVEFLRHSFSTSCREAFTRCDTMGCGTLQSVSSPTAPGALDPDNASRHAQLLRPVSLADALSGLTEPPDQPPEQVSDLARPYCDVHTAAVAKRDSSVTFLVPVC